MPTDFYLTKELVDTLLSQVLWGFLGLGIVVIVKDWFSLLYQSIAVRMRNDFREGEIVTIDGFTGEVVGIVGFRLKLMSDKKETIVVPISVVFEKPHLIKRK